MAAADLDRLDRYAGLDRRFEERCVEAAERPSVGRRAFREDGHRLPGRARAFTRAASRTFARSRKIARAIRCIGSTMTTSAVRNAGSQAGGAHTTAPIRR